jgi:exodeoxyribonuclease V alpha subunit
LPAGEAFTLHRLLGGRPGQHRYRYNEDNPLPYDVVIVDEASMADMALMAKLMAALPANGRLILLGDRDQLSSVEAGAVLGDIGDAGHDHGFSAAHARRIRDVAGETVPGPADGGEKKKRRTADSADGEAGDKAPAIGDCIVILRYVYRTGEGGSLGALASAVNAGDGEAALGILKGGKADARWEALPAPGRLRNALRAPVVGMYRSYLEAESPEEALARFQGFRILCAHRVGPHGTERVNELVREILAGEGWLGDRAGAWYHGRPVMVTENDYSLRLFNGDIGITWIDETGAWVCFAGEGGVRKVRLTNMPMHETVYAMTVHKSQGSEFDEVLLVLAMKDSPILTRELIYTGLTRARRSVTVWGVEGVFSNGVRARISRESGLRDALWAGTE